MGRVEAAGSGMVREARIERYDVRGRPALPELQALVDLAAQVCRASSAAISLGTGDDQEPVAVHGAQPLATGPAGFSLSAPLVDPHGAVLGTLSVGDQGPRRSGEALPGALATLAQRVVDVLELRARSRELDATRRELAVSREELLRSNEHLTLFAAQVSHDLRTPLTAVLANAEMLAGESAVSVDEDLGRMVHGITRGAQRMNAMIEEMSSYAREGATPKVGDIDLGGLVDVVLGDLAPVVTAAGATVVVEELPTVRADAELLYRGLVHLIGNAVKFARPDVAPEIRVSARRADTRWRVSVTDNGIGVPSGREQAMFVLFAQADKRTAGSGIGLATVRRIVEAHGGRVGLHGLPEGGTTVWFELPA